MQSQNRFLDDFARVATGAMGSVLGIRPGIEQRVREQFRRILDSMDLVTRDEFEAVKLVAATARAEQEALGARLAALEARLGGAQMSDPSPIQGVPPHAV